MTASCLVFGLTGCGAPQQRMSLGPSEMSTPPHTMSRGDYPFDSAGNYIDSWARAGATRYGAGRNSDDGDRPAAPRRSSSRAESPPSRRATPPARPTARSTGHTVSRGDTLSSLSRRYGVSVESIKRANKLKSNTIQTGRRLTIPR